MQQALQQNSQALQTSMQAVAQRLTVVEQAAANTSGNTPSQPLSTQASASNPTGQDNPSSHKGASAAQIRSELAKMGLLSDSSTASDSSSSSSESSGSSEEDTRKKKKKKKRAPSLKVRGSRKSGRNQTSEASVVNTVNWPHHNVYKGKRLTPAVYDQLSIEEFLFGYMEIVTSSTTKKKVRKIMITHLRDLMQDTVDYCWESVRNFHGVLLMEMERDRITWTDKKRIQKLRRQLAQCYPSPDSYEDNDTPRPVTSASDTIYCPAFQSGTCSEETDHGGVRHVCAFCLKVRHRVYQHAEKDCQAKAAKAAHKKSAD